MSSRGVLGEVIAHNSDIITYDIITYGIITTDNQYIYTTIYPETTQIHAHKGSSFTGHQNPN